MTSRERVLAAIHHEETDRVPVDLIHADNGDEVLDFLGIGCCHDWDADRERFFQAFSIDGRMGFLDYRGELKRDENGEQLSEWGCLIGNHHVGRHYPLAEVTDSSAIARHTWPDPAQYDYAGARKWAEPMHHAGYAVRVRYWHPFFVRCMDLMGFESMIMMMVCEPALFEAVVEKIFEINLAAFQGLIRALGDTVPILACGDDVATQRGMMISPEMWRKYFKGRWRRLFEECHAAGKLVWFHSCGDITPILPDLIDIGMDVWETVQLHTLPMMPEKLKAEYGRDITFFGGINTQRMPFVGPDEIRKEVCRCIDLLGRGGGYICGPDHHIPRGTPPENTVALFETALSYQPG